MSSAPYASVSLEQPIFTIEEHPEEAAAHAPAYLEHEYEYPYDQNGEEEKAAEVEEAPLPYNRKARKHLKTTVVELHLQTTTSRAQFPIQRHRAYGLPKEDRSSRTLLLLTSTTTYPDFVTNVEQRLQDPFYTRQTILPTNKHLYIFALLVGTHAQIGDLRVKISPATWPAVQKLLLKHRLDDGAFIEVTVCKDPFPGMEWSKSKSHVSVAGAGSGRAGRRDKGVCPFNREGLQRRKDCCVM